MSVALEICAAKRESIHHDDQVREGLELVGAVVRQVRASVGSVLPEDEMISFGNEGLVDAMMRFEPGRGVEFKVYAAQRIRGAIFDGMRREGLMPRRAWERAAQELGENPFEYDAEGEPVEEDGDAPSIEDLMIRSQETLAVRAAMEELAPEQAELVLRHYEDGDTLTDIAQDLGYSRSWASRSLATAHDALRSRLGSREGTRELCRRQGGGLCHGKHPAADSSLAQASARHPGADSSPAQATARHPGADSPLAQATARHPAADSSLAQASARHPGADSSLAQASARHPGADSSLAQATARHPGADSSLAQATAKHPGADSSLAQATARHPAADSSLAQASMMHPGATSRLEFAERMGFHRLATVKVAASEGLNRLPTATVANTRRSNRLPTTKLAGNRGSNRHLSAIVPATGRSNRLLWAKVAASAPSIRSRAPHGSVPCPTKRLPPCDFPQPPESAGRLERRHTRFPRNHRHPSRDAIMSTTATYRSDAILQNEPQAEAVFRKLRPKYIALPSAQVMSLNLDLGPAIATLSAATSRILALRPALAQLYQYNLAAVDELPDAILGLEYTHAELMTRTHPSDDLEDLNREAIQTRDRFLHDQANLAKAGVVDSCRLGQFTGTTGYKAVVTDIRTSVAVYRAIGAAAEGKSCCTPEDISRAEIVIRAMERLIGERNLGHKSVREWIDMRARAFTVVFNDYGEARRGVNYLRWHEGDADSIAPSLYKGRIKKRRSVAKKESARAEEKKQAEPQPAIGPNGPFVQASADNVAAAPSRLPGMPGGNPFVQTIVRGEGQYDFTQQLTRTGR